MGMPISTDRAARFLEFTSAERSGETLEEMFQRMTCRVPGVAGPEGAPEGLPAICAAWDVPYGRMLAWLMADVERYRVYERALEVVSHALVSEAVGIADGEGFPQDKRVRIDTRFRVAKHHAPDMYGDRSEVVVTPLELDSALDAVAGALMKRLGAQMPQTYDARVVDDDEACPI